MLSYRTLVSLHSHATGAHALAVAAAVINAHALVRASPLHFRERQVHKVIVFTSRAQITCWCTMNQ